jgi:orotidine-5'-phosphate decarboxylase
MSTGLIVALDVKSFAEAKDLIDELSPVVDVFKIGGILYLEDGNRTIEYVKSKGRRVFLDLKFFDIPNTVKETSYAAAKLGVDMFTIHLLGGKEMIAGALKGSEEGASAAGGKKPLILGVTILTSMNEAVIRNELRIGSDLPGMVLHLARQGYDCGLRGFVCSPHEIEILRGELGGDATLVTPGVRLAGDGAGDQKRVMTPKAAKELGASYIVMGRSVLDKPDRPGAVKMILEELA